MKILIIGSKGFIGSHALDYFSSNKKEYTVYGADVVVDYTSERYFLLDSTNSNFHDVFEGMVFDACINCSGAASVPDSLERTVRDFSLNTFNVVKMLDAIKKYCPACRFVNLSSAAVYGNAKALPIKESTPPKPISPYGLHKLFAEQVIQEYVGFFGLKGTSLRIFSAYGEGLKKQIFWDIYRKSISSKIVTLFGTGSETRDFIHVTDIVRAIELILVKGNFDGGTYNIANGREITIADAAASLLEYLSYRGTLRFKGNSRTGDPLNWRADISKIAELGYTQSINIQQGIQHYAKWLKEEKLQ